MKNLFIIKQITENKDISDRAFTVWCGLRNLMLKDVRTYFVSFNMIADSIFNRIPNRYELEAVKQGYEELRDKGFIKELTTFSKTEFKVDLKQLYYESGQGYFADLYTEEMNKIMSLDCGKHSKYKLLRYYTCMIGTFNRGNTVQPQYKGKIGGMSLDSFTELINISKPTIIAFNSILEDNKMLFVVRHKDFYQSINDNSISELREIPNTYSRWKDRSLAKAYSEQIHGYVYKKEYENKKTDIANKKRSLGQKIIRFIQGKEYNIDTIREMYIYAVERNKQTKAYYEQEVRNGYNPTVTYIDLSKFDDYLVDICIENDEKEDEE